MLKKAAKQEIRFKIHLPTEEEKERAKRYSDLMKAYGGRIALITVPEVKSEAARADLAGRAINDLEYRGFKFGQYAYIQPLGDSNKHVPWLPGYKKRNPEQFGQHIAAAVGERRGVFSQLNEFTTLHTHDATEVFSHAAELLRTHDGTEPTYIGVARAGDLKLGFQGMQDHNKAFVFVPALSGLPERPLGWQPLRELGE